MNHGDRSGNATEVFSVQHHERGNMSVQMLGRRQFLRNLGYLAGGTAAFAPILAGCQPQIIKETVVVEKEVEKVVKETVVVKEEVSVEKEVTRVVEKRVEVEKITDPAILRFWHHWSANRHPPLQQTVKEFEERNPGIKVVENLLPQASVTEKILTSIAAGDAPNVSMLIRRKLQTFAAEGALTELDSYLSRDGIDGANEYYPAEWSLCSWQGTTYTLPLTEGVRYLFYNIKLFEEAGLDPTKPPKDWAELEEYATKLTKFDGDKLDVVGFNAATWPISYLVALNGKNQMVSDDRRSITLDTPAAVEALEWAVEYTNRVNGGNDNVKAFFAQTGAWEQEPILSNKEAMTNSAAYMHFFFQDYAPDVEYGIAKFPHGPQGNEPISVNYPSWGYVIPTGVSDQDESWQLLRYMCHGEGLRDFMRRIFRATALKALNEDPWYLANVKHWEDYLPIQQAAVPVNLSPVFESFLAVQNEAQEKALYGKETSAQALAWAQEEGEKLLAEFWETH